MANKPLLVKGGHIIDPSQGIDAVGSLLITDDSISWVGHEDNQLPADYDILFAGGMVVSPGFVDLHCHLREPGYEDKETIATGSRAAAAGGFTTVCCMPNTNPPLDSVASLTTVSKEIGKNGVVRVLPIASITANRAGERLAPLSELASAGAIGFSDDGDSVMNISLMIQALRRARELGLVVIEHCEHKDLVKGGVMNRGALSATLGLPGIPAVAEEIIVARDVDLCRMTGGHLHIAHASTAGTVEIIRRAKKEGLPVTAEVTPHHLTLTEESIRDNGANAKVNPPLRTAEDIRALVDGLKDGVIDAIATDHAPHTEVEKARGMIDAPFGLSVFETALGSCMGLVHAGELQLAMLVSKLTREPAAIIGDRYGKLGTLEAGSSADVVIFDYQKEWVVNTDSFVSKGRNTPLAGTRFKGKVMATISRGKIAFCDPALKMQSRNKNISGRQV